jgi:hypothetical protein
MSKALEAAVKAAAQRTLCAPIGPEHVRLFNADDARAIITAFLDAAAEDERVARAIFFRGPDMGDDAWNHCQRHLREMAKEQAASAILALKEAVG